MVGDDGAMALDSREEFDKYRGNVFFNGSFRKMCAAALLLQYIHGIAARRKTICALAKHVMSDGP